MGKITFRGAIQTATLQRVNGRTPLVIILLANNAHIFPVDLTIVKDASDDKCNQSMSVVMSGFKDFDGQTWIFPPHERPKSGDAPAGGEAREIFYRTM